MPDKRTPAVHFAIELAQPDIITQRELQAILDLDRVMDHLIIDIRLRMDAGAEVEPGTLLAISDEDLLTDADHVNKGGITGVTTCGLKIHTVQSYIEQKEKQPCQS